jgi:imidazoleglycerol-phosphate dehydratase/histidinol-phosphatase
MRKQKILFLDRDGTLIIEPDDKQVDSLEKFQLQPDVVPALIKLRDAGFAFVMVTNQDGYGTGSFPEHKFVQPQNLLLDIFRSQGITFESIRICPHLPKDNCDCRKPKLGLVLDYLREGNLDLEKSLVIGDRETDLQLAKNMGIQSILFGKDKAWLDIAYELMNQSRKAQIKRTTKETDILVKVDLDCPNQNVIQTGIGFFDHMLEQLAKHGGFSLQLNVKGDLHIDEHHTVEDVALALGQALRQALGDKLGINRYGFLLPMDESLAHIALDLSGRPYFTFEGKFDREKVGELPTELVPHFFRSLAESLAATLNIKVQGNNAHHMIESIFKGVGRALRMALNRDGGYELPTTKGSL